MSGIEILGAVAAAIQLAETGLKIVKLISSLPSHVEGAPTWIKRRQAQIQHLVEIARIIQSSSALQTSLVQSLLESCSREAKELEAILADLVIDPAMGTFARYWKAAGSVRKEKRIAAICDRLEEEKSAITLCIVSISSSVQSYAL